LRRPRAVLEADERCVTEMECNILKGRNAL
jgi:hypothetical protein